MSTNMSTETYEKIKKLTEYGFTVGARDYRLNTDYNGKFMVVESFDESDLPTLDGVNGPWCIVGDRLDELVEEGYNLLEGLWL